MWGAIIGDLAGSIYEFDQTKKVTPVTVNNIIEDSSFYSDDTILTIAILDAYLNDKDYEKYLKEYALNFLDYKPNHQPYFQRPFSPGFIKWTTSNVEGKSNGNGAMMRISPIGYLSKTEEELITNTTLATICSHNNEESISGATTIAKFIYLAKKGYTKEDIFKKLNIKIKFIPFEKFNMTCATTIDNCLYAIASTNSFEDAIRLVISFGGDTDTNACIVGGMAEALYGIDNKLIEQAREKIPENFVNKLEHGYSLIKKDYQL